jgi:hypothetical protein
MTHGLTARAALEANGFRFTHSLGQNFILDDGLISRILDEAGVRAGDGVLEIGAGAGVMTRHLPTGGRRCWRWRSTSPSGRCWKRCWKAPALGWNTPMC